MYVIVQGINNLSESDKKLPIHDRIGIAMKHAGISITVTSVTDMAAFLIGSSSVSFLSTNFFLQKIYFVQKNHFRETFFLSPFI